jgi:hypothetical protein
LDSKLLSVSRDAINVSFHFIGITGVMKMIEGHNSTNTNPTEHATLPTPLFDADASASAQPVEPIHRSRISNWRNRFPLLSRRINGQPRMLIVVILIGLIIGALAGMLLVNIAGSGRPETVSEAPVNEPAPEMPVTEAQKLDTFAAALGGRDVQTASPTVTRNRRPRSRVRPSRPRAYRVAIIR